MSDPAQPLSRRERRAMEEAARAAEGDETQALPVAPESISISSRRERRRLERLSNPLESWTEEEEMIATGQMPAMTSEVLAEQDRLAHERAERAEAEALAAAAYAETAPEPEPQAAFETEAVAEPQAEPEAVAEPQPEPEAVAEPEPEAVAEPEPQPEPEPEPAPTTAGEIPADLRHLFPPGSLQARAFAAQQAVAAVPPTSPDAADEIRRLSQEAMAGITRATTDSTPVVPGTEFEPVAYEAPEAAVETSVPALPEGVDVEALWNAPTVDEPVREPSLPVADVADEADQVDLADAPAVADVPAITEPQVGEPAGIVPVWSALVPAWSSPAPSTPGQQPVAEPVAEATPPAPSMWDNHPLTHPGATPVRELPAEPVAHDLPRPDLTALLGVQATPVVGQEPQTTTEAPTTTGMLLRTLPEPQAGGGARHFRWVHLAVIGAIAFVLGVLVWNIARSGS